MTFHPRLETFTISRPSLGLPHASLLINSSPESAPHTLFTTHNAETNKLTTETLDIRAWRDNSVLEVFVNGRTAISTRLYAGGGTFGMRFFATDDIEDAGIISGHTRLESAMLWDGIGN